MAANAVLNRALARTMGIRTLATSKRAPICPAKAAMAAIFTGVGEPGFGALCAAI